jgi:hypothetical protein
MKLSSLLIAIITEDRAVSSLCDNLVSCSGKLNSLLPLIRLNA